MPRPKYKVHGQRGAWSAKVHGESLPCVHEHWTRRDSNGMYYSDPGCSSGAVKWKDFISLLETTKRVILTKDKVSENDTVFEREGYIGLFTIDKIESGDGFLRFRFLERTAELF
jgi:hypothetical protein